MCYPPDTDWSCKFTEAELAEMRNDPVKLAAMERSEAYAWSTLAALTAYRIGTCPITVRPCALGCAPAGTWMEAPVGSGGTSSLPLQTIGRSFTPNIQGGVWVNSCGCTSGCSCGPLSEALLPGPVGDVLEVKVDGVILDQSSYRIDNGNRLVRQDGGTWPLCQDMSLPADGEGTFSVTYYRGAAPNEITRFAAGALAVEFYGACMKDSKCRLPRGTVSVVRRGVSIEMEPDFMKSISSWPEIAPVIEMYNPNRLKGAPRVISPDAGRVRRQTWGSW
jgi:hypothetical protein